MILRTIPILILVSLGLGMTHPTAIPNDEFARRRAVFMDQLRDLDACAILHSAPMVARNDDVEHPYRQNSDLIYMTGWEHPNCILILLPQDEGSKKAEVIMFVEPRDPKHEVWTGPKEGLKEAMHLSEVDQALPYEEFFNKLPALSKGYDRWVVSTANDVEFEEDLNKFRSGMRAGPSILQEASSLIKAQRLIKSESEIHSLEKAVQITGESLKETFQVIPSLEYEYQVQAEIEYGFMKRGAHRLGFPSIVGAGKNATYLHYEDNRGRLQDDQLLLLDVGAEWDFYSADISRTVPIDGQFTKEQAVLYQIVLDAQTAAIESIKPGVSWREPHETAIRSITSSLVDLKLLSGHVDSLIANKSYRKFFMHGTSHWLGLDVHDAGGYTDTNKKIHKLKAGMVLTVEPGIYISESDDVDPKWWNIGIRIEDDVLVTPKGNRVLSADIPKTITEIEAIMQP